MGVLVADSEHALRYDRVQRTGDKAQMKYPCTKYKLHNSMIVRQVEIVEAVSGRAGWFKQSNCALVHRRNLFDSADDAIREAKARIEHRKHRLERQIKAVQSHNINQLENHK